MTPPLKIFGRRTMAKGFISLVLHAHLPFVRDRNGLTPTERRFYEAMTETYIPLLLMCRRLKEEGIPYTGLPSP